MGPRAGISVELRALLVAIDEALAGLYGVLRELSALDCDTARAIRRRAREYLATFPRRLDRIRQWADVDLEWPSEQATIALKESRETVDELRAILLEFQDFKNSTSED